MASLLSVEAVEVAASRGGVWTPFGGNVGCISSSFAALCKEACASTGASQPRLVTAAASSCAEQLPRAELFQRRAAAAVSPDPPLLRGTCSSGICAGQGVPAACLSDSEITQCWALIDWEQVHLAAEQAQDERATVGSTHVQSCDALSGGSPACSPSALRHPAAAPAQAHVPSLSSLRLSAFKQSYATNVLDPILEEALGTLLVRSPEDPIACLVAALSEAKSGPRSGTASSTASRLATGVDTLAAASVATAAMDRYPVLGPCLRSLVEEVLEVAPPDPAAFMAKQLRRQWGAVPTFGASHQDWSWPSAMRAAERAPSAPPATSDAALLAGPINERHDVLKCRTASSSWASAVSSEARALPNGADESGETALMCAVRSGLEDAVALLLSAGADARPTNREGKTALSLAVEVGGVASSLGIVDRLLASRADVNHLGPGGSSPLMAAAYRGDAGLAARLLAAAADPGLADAAGHTALLYAARNGHSALVEQLLGVRACVDVGDGDGTTELIWAARSGHDGVVSKLLRARSDVHREGHRCFSALSWAAQNGHPATAALLVAARAEVSHQDEEGNAPLALAALSGHVLLTRQLLTSARPPAGDVLRALRLAKGPDVVGLLQAAVHHGTASR